MDRNTLSETAT